MWKILLNHQFILNNFKLSWMKSRIIYLKKKCYVIIIPLRFRKSSKETYWGGSGRSTWYCWRCPLRKGAVLCYAEVLDDNRRDIWAWLDLQIYTQKLLSVPKAQSKKLKNLQAAALVPILMSCTRKLPVIGVTEKPLDQFLHSIKSSDQAKSSKLFYSQTLQRFFFQFW